MQLLGNMIEIFSRFDEIEQDNGKKRCDHHGRDGRYKKENVRLRHCFHVCSILQNAATLQKAHNDQDESDHQQSVDQSAERDGSEESQRPENHQDHNYCPHMFDLIN